MRRKFVLLAMRYPGLRLLLLRRTMQELRENHILPLLGLLKDYAKYNSDDKAFRFPNGSRLVLGYCDNDADCRQYQGQEYDVIGFEEATNFKEEWIRFISSCLRSTRKDFKRRIYLSMNPGGPSHAYMKRLFIDRDYIDGENPDDYVFIQAKVYDNKVLMESMPDYVKQLEALPLSIRKAHLDGDWNVYSGQVFDEFRNDPEHYADHISTHVIEPFPIPINWKIYRGYDFGYSKPWAVSYYAIDQDGRMYNFLELYGCVPNEPNTGIKMDVETMAKYIADFESQHDWLKGREIYGIADPAIWQKTTGTAVVEVLEKQGLFFDKGENKRIPSIQQIHYRLKFDENGIPMIYFFKNCKNMIRTLPMMQYDEHKPEDIDTDQEDHLVDTLRYVCAANPLASAPVQVIKPQVYDPLSVDTLESRVRWY